jgi:glycosyltransferase involved in cell wall biosynthesis
MKVLSVFGVLPQRIGGLEVFVRELSQQLGEHGCDSIVCYETLPEAEVRRFLDLPNVTLDAAPDVWKFDAARARQMAALLKRHRPDILHLYFTGFLSPYPWIARMHGVSHVYFTDQGSHPEGYVATRRAWWKRASAKALNAPLDSVICISDYNVACMIERGMIDPARVRRIYNSIDPDAPHGDGAAFRRKHGIPADALVAAQASWMIPEKGIGDLIEAARIVCAQEPRAHFLMAGEGEYRKEFMESARDMPGRFTWTGLVQNPTAEGLYTAADAVCQVSRWEEAFGWVIAEAMSARRPVVATRVGGVPELVEDGVTGFVVERRDPAAIADRLLRLFADPELRRQMGEAGRRAAERKFDLRRNVAELIRVYGLK